MAHGRFCSVLCLCIKKDCWRLGDALEATGHQTDECWGVLYTQAGYPVILRPPPPFLPFSLPHPHKPSISHRNTSFGHSLVFRERPCPALCAFISALPYCLSRQFHPFNQSTWTEARLASTLLLWLLKMCLHAQPSHHDVCPC